MSIPAPIPHPSTPTPTTGDLVARRVALKADLEYITGELAQIDAQLIDRLDKGTHDVDGVKVQIRQTTRTDYAALAEKYPADQYPALYKNTPAIDTTAVKNHFAPAALEEFKKPGAKSVVI